MAFVCRRHRRQPFFTLARLRSWGAAPALAAQVLAQPVYQDQRNIAPAPSTAPSTATKCRKPFLHEFPRVLAQPLKRQRLCACMTTIDVLVFPHPDPAGQQTKLHGRAARTFRIMCDQRHPPDQPAMNRLFCPPPAHCHSGHASVLLPCYRYRWRWQPHNRLMRKRLSPGRQNRSGWWCRFAGGSVDATSRAGAKLAEQLDSRWSSTTGPAPAAISAWMRSPRRAGRLHDRHGRAFDARRQSRAVSKDAP